MQVDANMAVIQLILLSILGWDGPGTVMESRVVGGEQRPQVILTRCVGIFDKK